MRTAIGTLYATFPEEPIQLNTLQILLTAPTRQNLVTHLYNAALKEQAEKPNAAVHRWEAALRKIIDEHDWQYSCTLLTSNCNLRIIHFKFLHQLCYTPAKLHSFGLRESNKCQRCNASGADFLHMSWACPQLQIYWRDVTNTLTEMLSEQIPTTPLVCILGIRKLKYARRRKFLAVALLLAKRRIAICWGSKRPPRLKDWITDMTYCKTMLETYAEDIPQASRPRDVWEPLVQYLQTSIESDTTGDTS